MKNCKYYSVHLLYFFMMYITQQLQCKLKQDLKLFTLNRSFIKTTLTFLFVDNIQHFCFWTAFNIFVSGQHSTLLFADNIQHLDVL